MNWRDEIKKECEELDVLNQELQKISDELTEWIKKHDYHAESK